MKILSIITLLSLSLNVLALDCAKIGGRLYPVDAEAKEIATVLKVKTCSGAAFQEVVSQKSMKIKIVKATKAQKNAYNVAKEARKKARAASAAAKLSF